jgi:ABC-type branched-subunit amino acid transport system ATPase component
MAYLEVSNVSKRFGGIRALTDCNFTIEPDKVSCVVGPNGAGKTTIFNVITGFLRPDEGTVRFRDEDLSALGRRDRVRRGVARTFQDLRLFDELSVLDNVMVCLRDDAANDAMTALFRPFFTNAVLRRKRDAARALLEDVGLGHKETDLASNLSYGQRKLLCIARVLATDAELLLLDEPTSGLAAGALDAMVELIANLKASGKTLLVVEHNTRIVRQIADDVLFFHRGTLMAQGTPEDIISNPELAEIYFGEGS